MNGMSQEYLIQVFQTFISILRSEDGEYFNYIHDKNFHIIYGGQYVYESRKAKRHILKNKKFMHKPLFAPYNYTVYITNAFCLSGYSNTHPEAPKLYLDAFLIDSSLEGYQRVYLLLGSNSNNTITVRSYEKFPDGRLMSVETQTPVDWQAAEHDLISFVDVIISSFCEITSICKLKKVTSKFNLEEAIL